MKNLVDSRPIKLISINYDILDISYFITNYWCRTIYFEGHFGQRLSYLRDGGKNTPVWKIPLKYIASYCRARFSRCVFIRQTLDIRSEIPATWKIFSMWKEACSLYVRLRLNVLFTPRVFRACVKGPLVQRRHCRSVAPPLFRSTKLIPQTYYTSNAWWKEDQLNI